MTTSQVKGLGLTISAREDGTLEAAYVKLSDAKVAKTEVLLEAVVLVDFDRHGELVGVELLAPVSRSTALQLAKKLKANQRSRFREFFNSDYAPRALVTS